MVELTKSKDGLLRFTKRIIVRIGLEDLVHAAIGIPKTNSRDKLAKEALKFYNERDGYYSLWDNIDPEKESDEKTLREAIKKIKKLFPEIPEKEYKEIIESYYFYER